MQIEPEQLNEIKKLCELNKVKSLAVFGSVLGNDFNKKSDIDFLVDFEAEDPYQYTDLYFNLKSNLENLFKRQIDLIEERGIKNKFFRTQLENSKVKIYGL
jgi:hypothetical protein